MTTLAVDPLRVAEVTSDQLRCRVRRSHVLLGMKEENVELREEEKDERNGGAETERDGRCEGLVARSTEVEHDECGPYDDGAVPKEHT